MVHHQGSPRKNSENCWFLPWGRWWWWVLIVCFLVLYLHIGNIIAACQHRYHVIEQDAYMHMALARDQLLNKHWWAEGSSRVNAPYGGDTHYWTKVVHGLLISGAAILQQYMSVNQAMFAWSFVVPMVFQIIAVLGMFWALMPMRPSIYQAIFIGSAFLVNPTLAYFYAPLRVDYDFLIITLHIIFWGIFFRMLNQQPKQQSKLIIMLALVACLGMWTAIVFVLDLFISLAIFIWLIWIKPHLKMRLLNSYLLTLCAVVPLIMYLEQSSMGNITYDVISIVHWSFLLCFLFAINLFYLGTRVFLVNEQSNQLKFRLLQCLLAALCIVMVFGVMQYGYPGFYRGPYNNLDVFLLTKFFPEITEFYSPFRAQQIKGLAIEVYFIIGVLYGVYLCINRKEIPLLLQVLFIAAGVCNALCVYMYRWVIFALPLNIWLASFVVHEICALRKLRIEKTLLILSMVWLPSVLLALPQIGDKTGKKPDCKQELDHLLQADFFTQALFQRDKILLIHNNYSPSVLYYTHFSIIASNEHHNPSALKDLWQFYKADQQSAHQMVMRRKVDLILLCRADHELTRFDPAGLTWLQAIKLPEKYSSWQLYRVVS